MHLSTIVEINNASFEYSNGQKIFEKLNLSILMKSRIGLIGMNGSGKSTLFKLISGELEPSDGHIKTYGRVGYVSQIDLYASDNSLSGGEQMKLKITSVLKEEPDLLLLDEPTNHLDVSAIKNLIHMLDKIEIPFIVISHDIFFLDSVVNEIWEVSNHQVKTYGGNYSSYKNQKDLDLKSKKKVFESAQHRLKSANALQQREIRRTNRNAKNRRNLYLKGSIGTWEYVGGEKGRGSLSNPFIKKIQKITEQAQKDILDNKVVDRKLAHIQIKNLNQKNGKNLIHLENFNLEVGGKILLHGVNFDLTYGDRASIGGDNGSGKTLFAKELISLTSAIHLYIDQHYSLLNFEKNLIDNIVDYLPASSEDNAKELLGKMQFKNSTDYKKLAKDLSGGELARLALAIAGALPLELLILDEPTNNLDIGTIEIMIEALNNYHGGLIVISHNLDFLNRLHLDKQYKIVDKKLLQN